MIEVCSNLFIGDQSAYENHVRGLNDWVIVHACKEPYHRKLLGYRGRGAPKSHPEYLIARRDHRLFLNLIDPDNPAYIPKEIIDAALDFIDDGLLDGKKVLVHCNQGESRSPGIGLLYLAIHTDLINKESYNEAELDYRKIYPKYNPSGGIKGFLEENWDKYVGKELVGES